jgi:hypothetical protein
MYTTTVEPIAFTIYISLYMKMNRACWAELATIKPRRARQQHPRCPGPSAEEEGVFFCFRPAPGASQGYDRDRDTGYVGCSFHSHEVGSLGTASLSRCSLHGGTVEKVQQRTLSVTLTLSYVHVSSQAAAPAPGPTVTPSLSPLRLLPSGRFPVSRPGWHHQQRSSPAPRSSVASAKLGGGLWRRATVGKTGRLSVEWGTTVHTEWGARVVGFTLVSNWNDN